MAEISISIEKLDEYISELSTLKDSWDIKDFPTYSCEGRTAAELKLIADLYKSFYNSVNNLATSSISYFTSLRDSYIEADNKSSIGYIT